MQITVFGANGTTGQEIVKALLARDHTVVCAVRRPETIIPGEGIEVRQVDLSSPPTVSAAIAGSSAVISALGSGGLKAARKKTTLYMDSARAIRAAMREQGVKRVIVLSSGGVEEEDAAPTIYNSFVRRYLMNTYIDMARMETIFEESEDLEWTCLRVTYLQNGGSKEYLVEDRELGRGNFKINYVDVAKFCAIEVEEGKWIRKMPVIGYP